MDFIFYKPDTGEILSRISGSQDVPLERAKRVFNIFNPGGELAQITSSEASSLERDGNAAYKYNASTKKIERR